jgi:hypothetical protein
MAVNSNNTGREILELCNRMFSCRKNLYVLIWQNGAPYQTRQVAIGSSSLLFPLFFINRYKHSLNIY